MKDSSREENVINQVQNTVQHPVLKANIGNIYKEIMRESRVRTTFFQHLFQPFRKIAIIGLGLMGGSICKALKMKDPTIEIGTLSYSPTDESQALNGGWIDSIFLTLDDLVENADLIILASPISTIIPYAEEIKQHAAQNKKLVVLDIASVKEEIVIAFEKLCSEHVEYIGSHPMAGKETNGFTNSQATLFVNRPWVIVPHRQNSNTGIDSIQELIRFLGAEPTCLEAKVHDQQAALISHLPALISRSYLDFVKSTDPQSLLISGPGFEAFTRLAHDNVIMHTEIEKSNKHAIQTYLKEWLTHLEKIG